MRIGIIGGWGQGTTQFPLYGERREFERLCELLGYQLGALGQSIIVGTDEDTAADKYVVRGFIAGFQERSQRTALPAPSGAPLISVIREGGRAPFAEQREEYGHLDLFTTIPRPAELRGAAKLIAVQEADAVITVAGFDPTYYAGLGAIYSGKRVVPIPLFGGASQQLLDVVQRTDFISNAKAYGQLDGPTGGALVSKVLELAGVGRRPRVMIVHGRGNDRRELADWLDPRCEVEMMIDEVSPGETLPEKYERLARNADAAIALATADDLAALAAAPLTVVPRARQNVWLEVGWFWGRLGRYKVMVLTRGHVEIPSDFLGVEFYDYTSSPLERADQLEQFIQNIQRR